jgi:mono/diheme cytochrome c family protein
MNKHSLFNTAITSLALAALANLAQAATERVGDFALLDEQGQFHQLSRYQHREAVVLLAFDHGCEAATSAAETLATLQQQHGQQMAFLALDINGQARKVQAGWELPFPVLADEMKLVSESLKLGQAGEVLVFNPQRMSLYYRGAAGDALGARLDEVAAGEASDTTVTEVSGCDIEYQDLARNKEQPADYSTEIAPIIEENCAICHRWGGAGPFAFDSYVSLLGWSPMVREVLLNKRMPPMQVDPQLGDSANAHFISAEDRQKLIHWMEAGAPRGDGEVDPLAEIPIEYEFDWQLGEPDYVVDAPMNVVPAVGIQDYVYVDVDLNFSEDKWVRAFQYAPGDPRVLHHLMAFVVPADADFWGPEKTENSARRRFLGSFIPGENPATVFPENSAVKIPAGHKLALQFHYVTNGVEIDDETRVGLYFSDSAPEKEILTRSVGERFTIAPGDPDHQMAASYQFEEPVQLLALRARMNYRGKHMRFVLEYPGGEKEPLFNIPAYNYGWQPHYWLDEPRSLPAGTTVHVLGAFDNSLSNPFNPDPREEVSWGLESYEEMFTGYLTYIVED